MADDAEKPSDPENGNGGGPVWPKPPSDEPDLGEILSLKNFARLFLLVVAVHAFWSGRAQLITEQAFERQLLGYVLGCLLAILAAAVIAASAGKTSAGKKGES